MPLWGMVLAALAEIRIGRVRVVLSTLCIAVGVSIVTLVIVFSGFVQQAAQQVFEQQTGRPVTLTIMPRPDNGPPHLTGEQIDRVRAGLRRYHIIGTPYESTDSVAYRVNGRLLMRNEADGEPPASTVGTDPSLAEIRRLPLRQGRWLNAEDDLRMEPQVVVSTEFAKKAGLAEGAEVGSVIEMGAAGRWINARIVGVLGKGLNWGRPIVFMPYASMVRWGIGGEQSEFHVRVPPADVQSVMRRLRADSTGSWGFSAPAEIMRQEGDFAMIGRTLGKLALAAAAAVLLLGSLSVLVLGLAAVRQRRSEFGVHRCFGATGPDLFLTVLTESLIVSVLGGAIGTALAYAGQKVAWALLHDRGPFGQGVRIDTSFPWSGALLGFGVALTVGVFTGLLPALRAMQRSVIRAIRD